AGAAREIGAVDVDGDRRRLGHEEDQTGDAVGRRVAGDGDLRPLDDRVAQAELRPTADVGVVTADFFRPTRVAQRAVAQRDVVELDQAGRIGRGQGGVMPAGGDWLMTGQPLDV